MRPAAAIYESFRPRLVIAIDPTVGRWTRDSVRAKQVRYRHLFLLTTRQKLQTLITHSDGGKTLRSAAQAYGIDTDAVALKVKQEFAAKEKARKAAKAEQKPAAKSKRAA